MSTTKVSEIVDTGVVASEPKSRVVVTVPASIPASRPPVRKGGERKGGKRVDPDKDESTPCVYCVKKGDTLKAKGFEVNAEDHSRSECKIRKEMVKRYEAYQKKYAEPTEAECAKNTELHAKHLDPIFNRVDEMHAEEKRILNTRAKNKGKCFSMTDGFDRMQIVSKEEDDLSMFMGSGVVKKSKGARRAARRAASRSTSTTISY